MTAPAEPLVRIAGVRHAPFTPPPFQFDPRTGRLLTFLSSRFDDPGPALGFPQNQWFQTIYAATSPEGAFGELTERRRVRGRAVNADAGSDRDAFLDPKFPDHGTVTRGWRHDRQITQARVRQTARFVDISHPRTMSFLLRSAAETLEPVLGHPLDDLDLSDVMSRNRMLTQHLARYFHDLLGEEIAGIRYLSRHSPEWECWALFADRIEGKLEVGESRSIEADDPDLLAVARHFGLSVETDSPGEYLRPWLA